MRREPKKHSVAIFLYQRTRINKAWRDDCKNTKTGGMSTNFWNRTRHYEKNFHWMDSSKWCAVDAVVSKQHFALRKSSCQKNSKKEKIRAKILKIYHFFRQFHVCILYIISKNNPNIYFGRKINFKKNLSKTFSPLTLLWWSFSLRKKSNLFC